MGSGPPADVGDNEKIAAEPELIDERKFGIDLASIFLGHARNQVADARIDEMTQMRQHVVPRRDRVVGKRVTQIA